MHEGHVSAELLDWFFVGPMLGPVLLCEYFPPILLIDGVGF